MNQQDHHIPLTGDWRHSQGMLFCGTLRIAKQDFDTDPSPEFQVEVFDQICRALNGSGLKEAASDDVKAVQIKFDRVMALVKNLRLPHGTCEPRSRKACTHCNAWEELDAMVDSWPGAKLVLSSHVTKSAEAKGKAYGYDCPICGDPLHDRQPVEQTDNGLTHSLCLHASVEHVEKEEKLNDILDCAVHQLKCEHEHVTHIRGECCRAIIEHAIKRVLEKPGASHANTVPGRMALQKSLPNESGLWWWWDGDEDGEPIPVNISYSGSNGGYFATPGQWGWNRYRTVEDMGGWWCPCVAPSVPNGTENQPADQVSPKPDYECPGRSNPPPESQTSPSSIVEQEKWERIEKTFALLWDKWLSAGHRGDMNDAMELMARELGKPICPDCKRELVPPGDTCSQCARPPDMTDNIIHSARMRIPGA